MKKKQFFFGFLVALTAGVFFFAAWGEYQFSPKDSNTVRASLTISRPAPMP